MSNPTTIPKLIEHLDNAIRGEKDALDRWMGSFAEQPLYAFQWADRTIMDAARMAVYTVIRHSVTTATDHDGNTDIPRCMASLDRSARGALRAGLTAASTSTVSNDAERKLGAAWNEIWFGDSFDTGIREILDQIISVKEASPEGRERDLREWKRQHRAQAQ